MKPLDCHSLYEDADFYDLEFAARTEEIPFYLQQARSAGDPVLEVACGTGRLTLPLARAGVAITGLDVSRPMIELARRKAVAERLAVEWVVEDCRTMQFAREFQLIFSATNALQHLLDLESISAFLRAARRALAPGGKLILDVFNPAPAKLARGSGTRYLHKTIAGANGRAIHVEAASEYSLETQILHFDLFYLCEEALLRTKQVNMRCFFPEELLALCRFHDLEVVERFGDYDASAFAGGTPKQILICRRKPS